METSLVFLIILSIASIIMNSIVLYNLLWYKKGYKDLIDKLDNDANISKLGEMAEKIEETICEKNKGVIFPGFDIMGKKIPEVKIPC